MTMRFEDKVCVVTGGASGIGRATCLRLAREGAVVVVVDIDAVRGDAAARDIVGSGGTARFLEVDVADTHAVQAAAKNVAQACGRIDVLVNSAAIMAFEAVVDLNGSDWDRLMAVNLRSVFAWCKYCIPHMQGGAIVNISSVHAHRTTTNTAAYAASKAGVEAFTRGLSLEHDSARVRVNCVAPGAVDTPMLWRNPNIASGAEQLTGPVASPEALAAAICFLASSDASAIHGATLLVDNGRLQRL